MSLLPASLPPITVILIIIGVVLGFFRHLIQKILVVLLVEIIFFLLFPNALVYFAHIIGVIRGVLIH